MRACAREQTRSSHCSLTWRKTEREASSLQMFLRALISSWGPPLQTPSQGGRVEFQHEFWRDTFSLCLPRWLSSKESTCNAGTTGDTGSIPGLGRSSGAGHGNPLPYSCLENPCGQRSLAGYSPWGPKELDTTDRLSTGHYFLYLDVFHF